MDDHTHNRLRRLPKVDRLLERPEWRALAERFGPAHAVEGCRKALTEAKNRILGKDPAKVDMILDEELDRAHQRARLMPLGPVINATGVILHTNLGRAPYGRELIGEVLESLGGACNLEIDLTSGRRGARGDYVRETLARLCGAEDALVVNNNAAAVLLALSALAAGREVIVSRGELIQIGGGFRIPEVIRQGGARLREVGTTNITTVEDYRRAIGPETAALLKVHLSNFHLEGFARRPDARELAALKTDELPLIEDLGSGNLLSRFGDRALSDPTPARVLADGVDLVCFSGDKLLGGPQAGLIAGRKDLIALLAGFPLMRAVRPDKFLYAMLQAVLACYERGEAERVAPWRQLRFTRPDLVERIEAFREGFGFPRERHPTVETEGEFGAGSLPGQRIESAALVVADESADRAAETFRRLEPPVVGVIRDGRFLLDFLTVAPEEEADLAEALRTFLKGKENDE